MKEIENIRGMTCLGCAGFILKDQGFVKIPGYEPVELDLEKLFLLSVSKGNLDSRRKT